MESRYISQISNEDLFAELGCTPISDSTLAIPNRYKGKCQCGAKVAEAEGFYCNNATWCANAFLIPDYGYVCPNTPNLIANAYAQHLASLTKRAEFEATAEVRAAEAEARRIAYIESDEGKAEIAREKAKAADLKRRGLKVCRRCGGAGGSSQWDATGYNCYGCGGSGTVSIKKRQLGD